MHWHCSEMHWHCSGMHWHCRGMHWHCSEMHWHCSEMHRHCSGTHWHCNVLPNLICYELMKCSTKCLRRRNQTKTGFYSRILTPYCKTSRSWQTGSCDRRLTKIKRLTPAQSKRQKKIILADEQLHSAKL